MRALSINNCVSVRKRERGGRKKEDYRLINRGKGLEQAGTTTKGFDTILQNAAPITRSTTQLAIE